MKGAIDEDVAEGMWLTLARRLGYNGGQLARWSDDDDDALWALHEMHDS